MSYRCNAYGAENRDGQSVIAGGLLNGKFKVAAQWHCTNKADHRFRWVCERGHVFGGEPVSLCEMHYLEFTGSELVAVNMRRDVQTCPRCSSLAPAPELEPKVKVRLVAVS